MGPPQVADRVCLAAASAAVCWEPKRCLYLGEGSSVWRPGAQGCFGLGYVGVTAHRPRRPCKQQLGSQQGCPCAGHARGVGRGLRCLEGVAPISSSTAVSRKQQAEPAYEAGLVDILSVARRALQRMKAAAV